MEQHRAEASVHCGSGHCYCSNVRKLNSNLSGWGKPYLKAEKALVVGG